MTFDAAWVYQAPRDGEVSEAGGYAVPRQDGEGQPWRGLQFVDSADGQPDDGTATTERGVEPSVLVAAAPITGSVTPTKRQQLVDSFGAARTACALVSQIEAGGVGLNIQAASVVVLAEPQWKPSTEEQAIARCHRMGQARPVDVHRLLAEDSVDQRMLEILATKAALFDEYVRRSELKEISPDAVDVSDVESTKDVVSIAEEERRIVEAEQRRLGLPLTGVGGPVSA